MSPLTRLYLAFSRISGPLWRLAHRRRLASGKELPERIGEKYGRYRQPRPAGEVLWFHALSVGESLALVPLVEKALAERPLAHVLVTTSTATSAAALGRAGLPERCLHVLLPIDTAGAVGRFLDHWRPGLAAFAELDFWPRLMIETRRRGIPMILINSRLPETNFARRRRLGGLMRDVLALFDALLVQDEASGRRFAALGADPARIRVVGALKAAARPLPTDPGELARLRQAIGARPVWLAAATFASEHAAMIAAHRRVRDALPEALLILAPRHVADGAGAAALAEAAGFRPTRRSQGRTVTGDCAVHVADTIGEMGLWYRLAPVSFVGHSLGEGLEGKNPFEAAALGSAILAGPATAYFAESYAALAEAGAMRGIADAGALADAVIALQDPAARAPMLAGAEGVIAARRGVVDRTWDALARLSVPAA